MKLKIIVNKNNFLIETIIFMFLFFILIDMINGILLHNGYVSISYFYKLVVLLLIIVYLMKIGKVLHMITILAILSLYFCIHFFTSNELEHTILNLTTLIKYLSIIIFYYFFVSLIKKQKTNVLFLITKVSFTFLIFNIFIGFIGFGYPMYGNEESGIGTRGLIFAGNELGVALIVSGSILMMYYLHLDNYKKFFIIGILIFISSALLTSKVSLLGSFLLFFVLPMIKSTSEIKNYSISRLNFMYSSIILIVVPLFFAGAVFYALHYSGLIDKLLYYADKVDLITLILSGRNERVINGLELFVNNFSFIEYFFGSVKYFVSSEVDFFDMLFQYGFFGLIISYGFILFLFIRLFYFKINNQYSKYLIFIIPLILSISLTGGHVFGSGTAGYLIAIVLSFTSYDKRNINI